MLPAEYAGLGKVDKIYLDNTNLIYSLAQDNSNIGNIRETFFLNQTRIFSDVVASPVSDFLIDDMTFEVGGKKKGQKQIQEVQKGFVVKDDIERGFYECGAVVAVRNGILVNKKGYPNSDILFY